MLQALGLLAAAALFAALWRLTGRAGSGLAAVCATAWAAAICIGAPNGGAFLFPYSFDALFALAGGFVCLAAAAGPPSRSRAVAGAGALAAALAAKPEIGAAAFAALAVAAARDAGAGPGRSRHLLRTAAGGVAGAALAWAAAAAGLPASALFPEGPLALFSPPEEWRAVYRVIGGFADLRGSLSALATALFLGGLVLAAVLAAAKAAARTPRGAFVAWLAAVAAATLLLAGPWAAVADRLPPLLAPMPLLAAVAAVWRLRRPFDDTGRARFLLFAFSAAAASRVALGVLYGALTTPYTILAVPGLAASAAVLVLDVLARRTSNAAAFRRAAAVVFAALAVLGAARWRRLLPPAGAGPVRTAAGTVRLPAARAAALSEVLAFLGRAARPGDGVAGFPETGFVNFATGLPNPLREEQILPGHLDAAAERRVVARLEDDRTGPRFVLVVNQAAPAFGATAFGRDYGVSIWRAVARRYRLAASFGPGPPDAPFGDPRFFLRVYERAAAPP